MRRKFCNFLRFVLSMHVWRCSLSVTTLIGKLIEDINRRLGEKEHTRNSASRLLLLTTSHRQTHFQRFYAQSTWNAIGWSRIVFTDESRFELRNDD